MPEPSRNGELQLNLALRYLTVICLSMSALTNAQTVYQSKDARGNPVFTDQPKPGAEKVELKPTNVAPAVRPGTTSTQAAQEFKGYSRIALSVTNPIPNGLSPTTVGVSIEPALQPGHSWQLKLDGAVVASGTESSATIPRIERGDHTFSLDVIGAGGVIGSAEPVNVFVFWPGGSERPRATPH
jgi:hypothetical protein